nr:hypothetical protein [Tanacetum cinerariifolium]
PEETGIKDLFGGEVSTMMSPLGSIVASFENVKSFFAVHTPPDHLIRAGGRPLGFQLLSCQQHRNQILKEQNPPEQSRLSILIGKKIL